jgi:ribose/xylose/arabinose/galactoside ABC-type transport system permease subunit
MAGVTGFMEKPPKWRIIATGMGLVVVIGGIDFLTGDYSILIFYLIPVSLVSWFSGRWAGATIAVASGCARFISDYALAINSRHLYWNSMEDMAFLVIVAFLIALLRTALERDNKPAP